MQNVDLLSQQIQNTYGRILELYQSSPQSKDRKNDVLPIALKELGIASEELQVALEELTEQHELLAQAQHRGAMLRLRYRDLFEFSPDALIITTPVGIIEEINRAAAALFDREPIYLVGKPLASLIAYEERVQLRNAVSQINQRNRAEFRVHLQRRDRDLMEVELLLDVIRNDQGKPLLLRWQLRNVEGPKRAIAALAESRPTVYSERYCKGELISLEPQTIWLVKKGIVKLTTLSESGEDILVGLAAEEDVFGATLTALPIYQAIALSTVELVPISAREMAQSPAIAQVLLPRIVRRLQQSERFLSIRGHLRVQDRLNQFLQLLKTDLGELIVTGNASSNGETRLKVKLTNAPRSC